MPKGLVTARIDEDIKNQAAEILNKHGLNVTDAIRILLHQVVVENGLPAGLAADPKTHDKWFRARVLDALESGKPRKTHEEVEASTLALLKRKNQKRA